MLLAPHWGHTSCVVVSVVASVGDVVVEGVVVVAMAVVVLSAVVVAFEREVVAVTILVVVVVMIKKGTVVAFEDVAVVPGEIVVVVAVVVAVAVAAIALEAVAVIAVVFVVVMGVLVVVLVAAAKVVSVGVAAVVVPEGVAMKPLLALVVESKGIVVILRDVVIVFVVEMGKDAMVVVVDLSSVTACKLNTVTPSNASDSFLSVCSKLEANCESRTDSSVAFLSDS